MVLFFSAGNLVFGVTFGGGYYWLAGRTDIVYAYNTDGSRSSENDINLACCKYKPAGNCIL